VAGRGLQPRPKRLTDEDMAVVIENGRDGGATPVPLEGVADIRSAGFACKRKRSLHSRFDNFLTD